MHSYDEVMKECQELGRNGAEFETIGLSRYGNRIPLVAIGDGDTRVMVVCRQHGPETTSTEAMLEYMNEIGGLPIRKKVKLFIIPVVNPDGAKNYERLCRKNKTRLFTSYAARSNHPYIGDINRDHKKRKTTEAQAIYNTVKRVQPKLIIDLHNFYSAYRYLILQKTLYDFCPACSQHPKIKPKTRRICYDLCEVSIEAVKQAGGKPAKINGLWPGLNGRLTSTNEAILETYYSLYHDIPAITLEVLGGFNLCSKRVGVGARLHKIAVHAVLDAFVSM